MTSDNFSYPVMSSTGDDYVQNKVVWSEPEISEEGGLAVIRLTVDIQDETISRIVNDGDAHVAVLVSCGTTNYRRYFPVSEIAVDKSLIAGEVLIEPSICASKAIEGYTNPNLSPDYEGVAVTIPKGGFIAIGKISRFHVSRQEAPDAESICKFVPSDDGREGYLDDEDLIMIRLPEDVFKDFRSLDKKCRMVFTAIHAPPVIADIIQKYWKSGRAPEDTTWSRVLKAAIDDKFPPSEDGRQLDGHSSYEIMMAVMGQMLSRGSDNLYDVYASNLKEDF